MRANNSSNPSFYAPWKIFTAIGVSIAYLLIARCLVGFQPDQVFLTCLFLCCYLLNRFTRRFILGFSIFIIYWIIFDFMKAFPNYRFNAVHIQSLYDAEKNIFGINVGNSRITPNEYWQIHQHGWLMLITSLCYLTWIPVPLLFAIYLFRTRRRAFFCFCLVFFLVNLIGWTIYYSYPAAPPWYVAQFGFAFHSHTPGSAAGLLRFDRFFNVQVFQSIYAKGSNVFAAMPSLHSAYPLIVFYFSMKHRLGWGRLLFAFITMGIWFGAIYHNHHYILDVLTGIGCAVAGISLFEWLSFHSNRLKSFIDWLDKATA